VERYADLTEDELLRIWAVGRKIGKMLRKYYNSAGVIYGLQDGRSAGQTVKHVHLHVIPRYHPLKEGQDVIDDLSRKDRSKEERTAEANIYKELLSKYPL